MKKNFLKPEMKISSFETENVVTGSGLTSNNSVSIDQIDENAKKSSVSFNNFTFVL